MKPTLLLIKYGGPSKFAAIEVARRFGNVVIVDNDPQWSEVEGVIPVASLEPQVVCERLRAFNVHPNACLTFLDTAAESAAQIARYLRLPGLDPDTVSLLKDKFRLRERLANLGYVSPKFTIVASSEVDWQRTIGFPLVLKPLRGAFGLGVVLVDSPDELPRLHAAAEEDVRQSTFSAYLSQQGSANWLVESYMEGLELSVEVLGHPTRPEVLAVHEKVVSVHRNRFREDRFVTAPFSLNDEKLRIVQDVSRRICLDLGFDRGVGNLEMRWWHDSPCVIEFQTSPTGGLVSEMVEISHGVGLHRLHVESYLRSEPVDTIETTANAACAMEILRAERPGRFQFVGAAEAQNLPGVSVVRMLSESGTVVQPESEYLGFVLCSGESPPNAVRCLERVLDTLRVVQSAEE